MSSRGDFEKTSSNSLDSKDEKTNDTKELKPLGLKEKLQLYAYRKGVPFATVPPHIKEALRVRSRKIYIGEPLPDDLKDKHGNPLTIYPRNKIRTTKYTPLTFIPMNLVIQFSNVANSYFLLVVILSAFQIFGVSSPGLAAVPLIVIVCITAIKDAFEDYRRFVSDADLNNSPIHLLTGVENVNASEDKVGPWRGFKKACTKGLVSFADLFTRRQKVKKMPLDEALTRQESIVNENSIVSARPSDVRQSVNSRHALRFSKASPNSAVNENLPVSGNARFRNRYWKNVLVGDFIRVRNNEEVPADMVLIATSDAEGSCYIETKNQDGETNLKGRKSLQCGEGVKHAADLERLQMVIEVEPPNMDLYKFKGVVSHNDKREAITNDNVLLRGCTLRNTKWALGVVVYTGPETKIMLNSGVTPTKKSRISRELNLSVVINFVLLFIMCFVSGLINGLFYDKGNTSRVYFDYEAFAPTSAANGVVAFFVTLIIYQSLVPISLYISIEIIKTIQAAFIYGDLKMYHEKLDYPCTPKTWNISDDLGQIEYIFSDKTGTLTQNVMEFKKCSVAGKSYGLAFTEAQQGMLKRQGVDVVAESEKMTNVISEDREEMQKLLKNDPSGHDAEEEGNMSSFVSSEFVKDIPHNEPFLLALALCHTVTPSVEDGQLVFQAESPDEDALVSFARDMGYTVCERTRNGLVVEIRGKSCFFPILAVIPFSSARKRMSVVTEVDGQVVVFTKGADNVIFERLDNHSDIHQNTALHLEQFAQEGLRTLCVTQKVVPRSSFDKWLASYQNASASISEDRELLMDRVSEELESSLRLLGGTAIEDRLQDGVPDAIALLRQAGIKLWVLTGDKVETAINIGFSCNLLENDMQILVLKELEDLETYLKQFSLEGTEQELELAVNDHSPAQGNHALVVEGRALGEILSDETLIRKFVLLCKNCKAVLCCRVSPAQKASVVKVVRDHLQVMTLAIGDGANDVAMIQAASVGVGIAGEEGRQAVMSSDYAIGQFRFLTRLVLVHGRWGYKRLAEMVPCFFYKNITFTFTLFWYNIYNDFDGSYLYEYTYLMFYNLAFTSLPVIFLAILDQDVSDTVSLLVPQLYRTGILRLEWSQYKFIWYMVDGLYQSVISFYFPYLLYYRARFVADNGLPVNHRFWMGVICALIAVVSCNLYVLLQQKRWDWVSLLIYAFSILITFFWTGVWSAGPLANEFSNAARQILGTASFWACFFVGVLVCLLPRFFFNSVMHLYRPKDVDIIRERVKMGDYDSYPKGFDPTDFSDLEEHRRMQSTNGEEQDAESQHSNKLKRKFNSLRKPIDEISRLKHKMLTKDEMGSPRMSRVSTTHELPGLPQAESLLSKRRDI